MCGKILRHLKKGKEKGKERDRVIHSCPLLLNDHHEIDLPTIIVKVYAIVVIG